MITTAKELRIKTRAILNAVARGEEVLVTHRGRTCARILPAIQKGLAARQRSSMAPLFGIWKKNKATTDVARHVDQLRRAR